MTQLLTSSGRTINLAAIDPAQIHLICHRVKKTIREFFQKKKEFSNFS